MTYRQGNSSSKDGYLLSQSRLNQQNNCDSTDEGCPVIEESGTVCGETNSLSIFQDFRQMYDDCLRKLEGTVDGNSTLKKLAPFKKFIDDLWKQNTMLVETVEELEQEATTRVTDLQDKLNKSCQKICDYKDDIKCLVKIIQSFCEDGVFDLTGLKFKTFCCSAVFGDCDDSCSITSNPDHNPAAVSFKKRSGFLRSSSQFKNGPTEETQSVQLECRNSSFNKCSRSPSNLPPDGNNEDLICASSGSNNFLENACKCDCKMSELNNCQENMLPVNINFNIANGNPCDTTQCCQCCSSL